jgi:Zn-dependent protease with chaperone function
VTRPLLILSVGLASYAVTSTLLSIVLAVYWTVGFGSRQPAAPGSRATWLVWLRLSPSLAGTLLTLGLVVPAFVAFEPRRASEPVGALLVASAMLGAAILGAATVRAICTALATSRLQRAWLEAATALDVNPPAGMPAYVVDAIPPTVALVGVFWPRLVAARSVIEACTPDELAQIVGHERGHLDARDNLKRWLLSCAPDVLVGSAIHASIMSAWHDASEDAADDRATRGREQDRVDLAALLIKVARLAPAAAGPYSSFADRDSLDRRVRRLLASRPEPVRDGWVGPLVAVISAGAVIGMLVQPRTLRQLYDIVEFTIALGR